MLEWIASIFKYPMQWFYTMTGDNYLLALCLFALFVRVLLLPLTIYQQKSQIKGAKLRPKIAIIEKKYAGRTDRDATMQKQQEISELQQAEGYSPLAGCLPLLIQLPIFLGLYEVVRRPLTYLLNFSSATMTAIINAIKDAGGPDYAVNADVQIINYIKTNNFDLSGITDAAIPNFTFGPFDLTATPNIASPSWLLVIPVLTFVLSWLSMKITRKLNTPVMTEMTPEMKMSNRIMDLTMPLMGVWICFSVPSAFGVYWLLGYVISILQTLLLAKLMPMPTFTPEEIRQFEKEMKASAHKHRSAATSYSGSGVIRSRHHIDDEEYVQPKETKKSAKTGVEPAPEKLDEDEKGN